MEEIWKQVKGYPKYEVSNHGRVRSNWFKNSRILRQIKMDSGYYVVSLYSAENKILIRINRLVLETFIGQCPDGMECSHLDGDKTNNYLNNLIWETHTSNNRRKVTTKLNIIKVCQIRLLLKRGWGERKLAEKFGVCRQTINDIKHYRKWKIEAS